MSLLYRKLLEGLFMKLLTKSRFKTALECPTKLYYLNHPEEFANKAIVDPFLQALADGGFQVGELAKKYYPTTCEITTYKHDDAMQQTKELLKKDVTVHEASFGFLEKFFVKTDIVVKNRNRIDLIEVKAKSFNSSDFNEFKGKRGGIVSKWKPYIYDITFQYWVVKKVYPECDVVPYLLMADKDKVATIDGLHQMFRIKREEGMLRPIIEVTEKEKSELGVEILTLCDLNEIVHEILRQTNFEDSGKTFEEYVYWIADICNNDELFYDQIGKKCKDCEFTTSDLGLKSGLDNCWTNAMHAGMYNKDRQKFYEVWNLRFSGIKDNKFYLDQLEKEDIDPKGEIDDFDIGIMTNRSRQWNQVKLVKENTSSPIVFKEGLQLAIKEFTYPYNFIDFETIVAAVPFHSGMRPYEMIAFQFSHHIMQGDGSIVHANEWINTIQGAFPNFEFIRELKKALSTNGGTIFRYSHHENTVLNKIKDQLTVSTEKDKDELIEFIKEITSQNNEKSVLIHKGERCMIDMCELVKKYYLHPLMKGSNSIKKVLPAILNSSAFLKKKYSLPIYGSSTMSSKNFNKMIWIKEQDGLVVDPYKLLDPFFDAKIDGMLDDRIEHAGQDDTKYIGDGGAAMMAYAEMQYSEVPKEIIQNRMNSLLKYCELDTLAMVMIIEEFKNL